MLRIIRYALVATTLIFTASVAQASSHQCAKLKHMKLKIDEYHLVLDSRKPICTKIPNTFIINIHNPLNSDHVIEKGDVSVMQKEGSPLIISGSNDDERLELKVQVSGNANVGANAKFLIKVEGVGVLDPKVRVVSTDALLEQLAHDLEELLDTLGLTWDDAARVTAMQLE
tara:strand:+ start:2611 stop:3123 length:513 start_codon:yes stop_codon:yes gene_type:complete